MDAPAARARLLASLGGGAAEALAAGSEGARVLAPPGVRASLVPATPDRSVFNAVVAASAGALLAAYPALEAAYADAGVRAWTVWVPEDERDLAGALAARGHVLDGTPHAMWRELDGPVPPPEGSAPLRLDPAPTGARVGALNDAVYGLDGPAFAAAYARLAPHVHPYVALVDGRPAGCCVTIDDGEDAHVSEVAVLPAARGRGLAGALVARALADAHARGRTMATLVATAAGRPVYARLGFLDAGVVQMWERRSG